MDMSMPSLLGYFMTMLYNPNNVSIEASPLTMVAEIEAGQQLCEMFGYNLDPKVKDVPIGWGHITCGGTVANLESIWSVLHSPHEAPESKDFILDGRNLHLAGQVRIIRVSYFGERIHGMTFPISSKPEILPFGFAKCSQRLWTALFHCWYLRCRDVQWFQKAVQRSLQVGAVESEGTNRARDTR